jgi:hypothetical protein
MSGAGTVYPAGTFTSKWGKLQVDGVGAGSSNWLPAETIRPVSETANFEVMPPEQ